MFRNFDNHQSIWASSPASTRTERGTRAIEVAHSDATPPRVRRGKYALGMKGDRVEVVVDSGNGTLRYEIEATKAGRRVEVSTVRGVVEVTEVTRSGTAIRSGRFMASRVLALVEHPAPPPTPSRRRPRDQASLL